MREFLIKTFQDPNHAISFLNKGEMLFRQASFFQKIEDDNTRGDINESVIEETIKATITPNVKKFYIGKNKEYMVDWEGIKKMFPDLNNNSNNEVQLYIKYITSCVIYCLTYVRTGLINNECVLKNARKFGEYSVVICDCKDFIEKIKICLRDANFGLVRYDDALSKDIFVKPTSYKDQNEFRIALEDNDLDNKIFYIGELKGFICKTSSLPTLLQVLN